MQVGPLRKKQEMIVVNAVLGYGCTPDKCLKIVSADVQGGRRESSLQISISFLKDN